MTKLIDCPICGAAGTAEQTFVTRHQSIENTGGDVKIYSHTCSDCGCQFAGDDDTRLNRREMIALRKRVYNLLSASRVREIRLKCRLTIEQAGKVFGGGPVAFSKYENDELCQSEMIDKIIAGAEKFPGYLAYLLERAGLPVEGKVSVVSKETTFTGFEAPALADVRYEPKQYRSKSEGVANAC